MLLVASPQTPPAFDLQMGRISSRQTFWPGGARYYDLPGMLAVAAPQATWITGEKVIPQIVTQVYQIEKAADAVTINTSPASSNSAAITWLLDSK